MLIRCRNQEWSSAARASTLRTAAFIVTASKSAPITQPTTSTGNGVTAAVCRAITFLSDQYFLGKCVWARTWRTSARALRRNRKVLRRSGLQLPQHRPLSRVAHPDRVLLRPALQVLQQTPVRLHQAHHRRKQPPHLHRRLLLRQLPDRQRHLRVRRRKSRQRVPLRMRLLLRRLRQRRQRMQLRPHQRARQEDRRGLFRRVANRRCILPPGIMYISFRRAVSTSIPTCPPIVSFIERAASVTHVRRMHCNLPVPIPRPQVGRCCPLLMQNVWSLI